MYMFNVYVIHLTVQISDKNIINQKISRDLHVVTK